MTDPTPTPRPGSTPGVGADDFAPRTFQPTRKDRLRPAELVGLSGVMALFVGVIVLVSTREIVLSTIFTGVAFIVVLVAIAMFSLTFAPDAAEIADLDEQNGATRH